MTPCSLGSGLPSPHLLQRCNEVVTGQTALLLMALAGLELTSDLFVVDGLALLIVAGAAVEF